MLQPCDHPAEPEYNVNIKEFNESHSINNEVDKDAMVAVRQEPLVITKKELAASSILNDASSPSHDRPLPFNGLVTAALARSPIVSPNSALPLPPPTPHYAPGIPPSAILNNSLGSTVWHPPYNYQPHGHLLHHQQHLYYHQYYHPGLVVNSVFYPPRPPSPPSHSNVSNVMQEQHPPGVLQYHYLQPPANHIAQHHATLMIPAPPPPSLPLPSINFNYNQREALNDSSKHQQHPMNNNFSALTSIVMMQTPSTWMQVARAAINVGDVRRALKAYEMALRTHFLRERNHAAKDSDESLTESSNRNNNSNGGGGSQSHSTNLVTSVLVHLGPLLMQCGYYMHAIEVYARLLAGSINGSDDDKILLDPELVSALQPAYDVTFSHKNSTKIANSSNSAMHSKSIVFEWLNCLGYCWLAAKDVNRAMKALQGALSLVNSSPPDYFSQKV